MSDIKSVADVLRFLNETCVNSSVITIEDLLESLDRFAESEHQLIIKKIGDIHRTRKTSLKIQIDKTRRDLDRLKAQYPGRIYGTIVNPHDTSQVYRTGPYPDWILIMARADRINICNSYAMKMWVKKKKN